MKLSNKLKDRKKNWHTGCLSLVLFVSIFSVTLFSFLIWGQYKKISIDLSKEVSGSSDPEILNNRKIAETVDDPWWGASDAKVVIVEFSDFECPFCKKVFPILREISIEYPQTVKIIYRDFLSRGSQKQAESAECANEQGSFLAYHDKLFLNQGNNDIVNLKKYAKEAGIADIDKFNNCLDSGKYAKEVMQDHQTALDLGVTGTPTFIINGIMIDGAVPKKILVQIVDELLKK